MPLAAENNWTPTVGSLITSQNDTAPQRTALHTLRWDQNGADLFGPNDKFGFVIELALNDSDTSQLGPGIFLDVASANVTSDLPDVTLYQIGGFGITQRFSALAMRPSRIVSGTNYLITWTSLAGTASQNNGDLLLHRTRQYCYAVYCNFVTTYYRVNQDLYTVAPIPGVYDWERPPQNRCLNWLPYWLPLILQQ